MSRGPGRVQRALLDTLAHLGPARSDLLTLYAGASEDSTRRALRSLRKAGRVRFLGFAGRGVGVWCLPEDEEDARACLPDGDMLARVSAVMGPRFARSLARSMLSLF
ncbi:MAG: hypothetical protein Q4C89_01445 [Deinococcus sp.]|uniref:hypothetical protein n=1 Tax=Deinococcus sp. TaxID=47478 RepID=UPI0026DC4B23|nr:hypothetical protein [Deinococcus sp.]MDO4244673.1 hypothetical protein [Deinococcus sp.]